MVDLPRERARRLVRGDRACPRGTRLAPLPVRLALGIPVEEPRAPRLAQHRGHQDVRDRELGARDERPRAELRLEPDDEDMLRTFALDLSEVR